MNAKKLAAGCIAAFVTAGSILSAASQTYARTERHNIDWNKSEKNNQTTNSSSPRMAADFYAVDKITYTADSPSKKINSAAPYDLSRSEWAGSGNDYYFSLLTTPEKKLYLNLKKHADLYLTGTDSFQTANVKRNNKNTSVYVLPIVSYSGLSIQQMKKVFYCFMFENPQYYFMRNSVIYSEITKAMTIGLYEIFADGSVRAEYTQKLAQQLNVWEQQINELETPVEKERFIHSLVCQHVEYNEDMETEDPDDYQMSQSCISAILFDQTTVCAGYAQMFSLLCNRSGIPCVTLTSAGHAWNKVRMGNTWYNVDCTWDDLRGDETFLNVTDALLLSKDSEKKEHEPSSEWSSIAPPCTAAFDPALANAPDYGENIFTPDQMSNITVQSKAKNKLLIQFEPIEDCDGYTVQYAANNTMQPSKQKNMEKTSCMITGLKKGKTYYIRVRAYTLDSNNKKLFGAYSKKIKATVKL